MPIHVYIFIYTNKRETSSQRQNKSEVYIIWRKIKNTKMIDTFIHLIVYVLWCYLLKIKQISNTSVISGLCLITYLQPASDGNTYDKLRWMSDPQQWIWKSGHEFQINVVCHLGYEFHLLHTSAASHIPENRHLTII